VPFKEDLRKMHTDTEEYFQDVESRVGWAIEEKIGEN
jgi:hypothetical protein